jgi:hypothetical protein
MQKICRHKDDLTWRHAVKSLNDLTKWPDKLRFSVLKRKIIINLFGSASGEDGFDTKNSAECR